MTGSGNRIATPFDLIRNTCLFATAPNLAKTHFLLHLSPLADGLRLGMSRSNCKEKVALGLRAPQRSGSETNEQITAEFARTFLGTPAFLPANARLDAEYDVVTNQNTFMPFALP